MKIAPMLNNLSLAAYNKDNSLAYFMEKYYCPRAQTEEDMLGHYESIIAIKEIVDMMVKDGNLVFTSCYTGINELFGPNFQQATNSKINLYLNTKSNGYNKSNIEKPLTGNFLKYKSGESSDPIHCKIGFDLFSTNNSIIIQSIL